MDHSTEKSSSTATQHTSHNPALLTPPVIVASPSSNFVDGKLLHALWRSPDSIHQLGTLDRKSGRFQNKHVQDLDAAIRMAAELVAKEQEVYFACAEYTSPMSRTAGNTKGTWAFWLDIDCGEDKAASGKGYATEELAEKSLAEFCKETGLPTPTIIVHSGGGLHVYWVLEAFVERPFWQQHAAKLKDLTRALQFLSDDTRTADIASVLRVPGTLNFKYTPPRPVTILRQSDRFISNAEMFAAIACANEKFCPVGSAKESATDSAVSSHEPGNNLPLLRGLIEHLDPDMDYPEWTKVIMAIHHETRGSEDGFALANSWSSRGNKYKNASEIRTKWKSLKTHRAASFNIGTLINMVKAQGIDWHLACPETRFEVGEDTVIQSVKSVIASNANAVSSSTNPIAVDVSQQIVLVNPFDQYSLRGMSDVMEMNVVAAAPLLGGVALMGQVTVFFAKGNVGKTVITFKLLLDAIKDGRVNPNMVYYLNVDDTATGLVEKNRIAEEYGCHMIAEGHRDFSAGEFKSILRDMIENDQARGVVLILDTLKKFVNLMDKNQTSAFTNVIRPFVSKGGTVIALAHTNKNPDKSGNPVYGGVSDIMNDIDCAYTIAEMSAENGLKVVEFVNVKRRGNVVYNASYSYCYGNAVSYHELLASVQPVDETDLGAIKVTESNKSDAEVVEAVKACIHGGINTKMKLTDAVAAKVNVSKRLAQEIIVKYTGADPAAHHWNFIRVERGAQQFTILSPTPQVSVTPTSPPAPALASVSGLQGCQNPQVPKISDSQASNFEITAPASIDAVPKMDAGLGGKTGAAPETNF